MPDNTKDVTIHLMPALPQHRALLGAVLSVAVLFLAILSVSEFYSIQNKIKEGRYIGQSLESKNTITVSGEGRYAAPPDIVVLNVSVTTEKAIVGEAQKENTRKMNAVIEFLKRLGIAEKDLKTINYTIYPLYDYPDGRQVFRGYQVSQTAEMKIRDLDKVGETLEGVTRQGANQVGSLSFTFDDPEAPRKEARKLAIAHAKEKAEILAIDLGVDLVRIVSFSEDGGGVVPPIFFDSAKGIGGGGESPRIEPGENETAVTVHITYEIN